MKFAREKITENLDFLLPLFKKNWEETGIKELPLDLNTHMYLKAEEMGVFRLYTYREESTELVGYSFFFTSMSPHHKTKKTATQDTLFIDKEKRGHGLKFILWCDEQLFNDGVDVITRSAKVTHDYGNILKRIGYEAKEIVYVRENLEAKNG